MRLLKSASDAPVALDLDRACALVPASPAGEYLDTAAAYFLEVGLILFLLHFSRREETNGGDKEHPDG